MRKTIQIALGLAFTAFFSIAGMSRGVAQTALRNYDFGHIVYEDAWLTSFNAAGSLRAPADISYVEAYYANDNGGFRDYSDPLRIDRFSLRTESLRKFGNIAFYGLMQYEYYDGDEWAGSLFIDPSYYCFDLVEFTPGRKTGEEYTFIGSAGFKLAGNLEGGLRVDYNVENIAKRKNLRHKNNRMDLRITPGLNYGFGKSSLGATYIYRKISERIQQPELVGGDGQQYYVFYNKGLWYGVYDLWTAGKIPLTEPGIGGFPHKFNDHGLSVQYNYRDGRIKTYHELSWVRSRGENGGKSIVWTRSVSDIYEYNASLSVKGKAARDMHHIVRVNAKYSDLDNYESILSTETINGVTEDVILGEQLIFRERRLDLKAEYEMAFRKGDDNYNPYLSLRGGFDHTNRSTMGTLAYPHVKSQSYHVSRGFLRAEGKVDLGRNEIKVRGLAGYSAGGGTKLEESMGGVLPGQDAGGYPEQYEQLFNYTYEYITVPKVEMGFGVRYTYYMGRKSLPVYCDFNWTCYFAPDIEYLAGRTRNFYNVKVGFTF